MAKLFCFNIKIDAKKRKERDRVKRETLSWGFHTFIRNQMIYNEIKR